MGLPDAYGFRGEPYQTTRKGRLPLERIGPQAGAVRTVVQFARRSIAWPLLELGRHRAAVSEPVQEEEGGRL